MKRTVSIIGIALISIMIFAACPGNSGTEDNGESKSVTITNITGLTGKVSVWVFEEQGQPETGIVARGDGVINNGSVTVELKLTDESGNITADEWTGNGPFYIAVGQEGAVPDYTTSAKVDINSAGTEIVGVEFESSGDGGGGVLGGIEEGISAFIIFGNFEGEKTIDELLQQLVEEAEAPFEGVTLTYELFKTFGGTIYLGPNRTGEVSGSTKITADTILYLGSNDSTEPALPASMIFGNFEGEKTIDELLQQLVEEAEAPFEGVTLTYELFKTFGGTIYLGPNQTGEVSGSTKITADTILYIPITEEEEIVDIEMYSELFSRSLRLPSLRPN